MDLSTDLPADSGAVANKQNSSENPHHGEELKEDRYSDLFDVSLTTKADRMPHLKGTVHAHTSCSTQNFAGSDGPVLCSCSVVLP